MLWSTKKMAGKKLLVLVKQHLVCKPRKEDTLGLNLAGTQNLKLIVYLLTADRRIVLQNVDQQENLTVVWIITWCSVHATSDLAKDGNRENEWNWRG